MAALDGEHVLDDNIDANDENVEPVCSICDDGGVLLCCEGICKRSFHATETAAAGAGTGCRSLGLTDEAVMAMEHFICQNCEAQQHQCFSCGQLGSSDIPSGTAEVFQCSNAACGYFYHPHCVARGLERSNKVAAQELRENIRGGQPFTCPHHICYFCRQAEDATDHNLQMAVCRRCPKAYHRRCLPGNISFGDRNDELIQRAWDALLRNRILMFCINHPILPHLGTPLRNHIRFPSDGELVDDDDGMIQPQAQDGELSDTDSHETITDVSSGAPSEHSEDEDP